MNLEVVGIDGPGDNKVVNNLIAKSVAGDSRIDVASGSMAMNEAESRFPDSFTGNIQQTPTFSDFNPEAVADFALTFNSSGVDEGVALTKTIGAGNGTTIRVVDAGYFTSGFGLLPGDLVRVGATTRVQIVAVDYEANTIEFDRSIAWLNGQDVTLEYDGSAPDIGAIEGNLNVSSTRPRAPTLAVQ